MDELHEELDEGGVSRRDALKKIGVAAAGFWAVPVISSFRSPALGVVSPVCTGHNFSCPGGVPTDFVECGTGASGLCFCDVDIEGNEGCFEDFDCSTFPTCTSNADCPSGTRCVADTCCGVPTCLADCATGNGFRIASVPSGLTPSGR